MIISNVKDLIPGKIYVTQGGVLTKNEDTKGTEYPWGYDRVKFLRFGSVGKSKDLRIFIKTPWGTKCDLPLNYPLSTTSETVLRSEFPLMGMHKTRVVIPFEEALKREICKELNATEIRATKEKDSTEIALSQGTIERTEFMCKVIDFFAEPHTMAEAAKHFNVKYQQIRYTVNNLNKKGFEHQRFGLKKGDNSTIQLIKV